MIKAGRFPRLTQEMPRGVEAELRHVPHRIKVAFRQATQLAKLGQRDSQAAEESILLYQQLSERIQVSRYPLLYAFIQVLLGLAYSQRQQGDRADNLDEAISYFEIALQFWTPQATPKHYVSVQNSLGLAYGELSLYDKQETNITNAIRCYEEALSYLALETGSLEYAITQQNLSIVYSELPTGDKTANLMRAIACGEEAVFFLKPETTPLQYASARWNLGNAYAKLHIGKRMENLRKAISHYQEALRIYTLAGASFECALIKHNLARVFCDLPVDDRASAMDQAITYYEEALPILTLEKHRFEYAHTQNNLGDAYVALMDLPGGNTMENLLQAIACYEKALYVFTPEADLFRYARTQSHMGYAYSHLPAGSVARAIACYTEALRFQTPETTPFEYRWTNRNLGDLYFNQREWSKALYYYHRAIKAGEQLYARGLSAESRTTEIAQNAVLYPHVAFATVRDGKKAVDALLILERGKTRVLTEALSLSVSRPDNVPDNVWNEYQQAAEGMRASQFRGTKLYGQWRGPVQSYDEEAATKASTAFEEAIQHVRKDAPGFLKEEIDLQIFQDLLPDAQTALVTFCITSQGSLGFVVSHQLDQTVEVVEIPNFTQAQLDRLFVEWDAEGRAAGGWSIDYLRDLETWKATMARTLNEVGENLLLPILSRLPADTKRLIFLPSNKLFLLPLHAVPLSGDGQEWTGKRYQISYIPSLKVLADTRAKATQETLPDLYAVINPDTEDPLLFAPIEGAAIAKLFGRSKVDEGQAATKQHVIDGVQGRTYVHFSCHGLYDWDDPLESCLSLADGSLTLAELQQKVINLSVARLVTLSACETGITDVMLGSAEEYVGVPAGFILAGVPCVISSLWVVDELSTSLLMQHFYEQLQLSGGKKDGQTVASLTKAEALRSAQQYVRSLTSREVIDYCERYLAEAGSSKGEVLSLQMAQAYAQTIAGDLQAAMKSYHEVLSRLSELDKAWAKRQVHEVEKTLDLLEIKMEVDAPTIDYNTPPYEHPYYWAPFVLIGDWK